MSERVATYPIERLIIDRWSRRAMSGEAIDDKELMRLLEAARWAPSARNNQPWRFVYAHKGTPAWQTFFDLLGGVNKEWAKNAATFVMIVSKKTYDKDGSPCRFHSFDAGAAWQNLVLQGCAMGLAVCCIGSFDHEKARSAFGIPNDFDIEVMVALGKLGKKESLPPYLQEKEQPTRRKPLEEIVFKETWQK